MRRIPWAALASLPFLYLAACSGESTAPGAVDARPTLLPGTPAFLTGTPTFLTLLPSAPPLVSATVSFYAVRGQDREGTIFFQRPDGRPPTGSDRAVRLRVRKHSLDNATLNGIPVGDSVLITMTMVDVPHQIVEVQPSGLVFNVEDPGKLTIGYRYADHDFNGDGVIDHADVTLEAQFSVWRQENPADPFTPLVSVVVPRLDQVGTDVPGFTRFAVAY
jgi:hypothetical protein